MALPDPSADPLLSDFRNYLFALWRHLGLPAPTPVQYAIAAFLQDGPSRAIIEAFRGVGKSWLTAGYVTWRLKRNRNERILVVSANEERSVQFTTFVRRLIEEWPYLADLKPQKGQRDSALSFDVAGSMPHQSPSLRAAGITGQITGGRASIIVADDIEVPKNSATQLQRDRLLELTKEFSAILMSPQDLAHFGMPEGEVIYLGTPQTEQTLYKGLEARGYTVRIWPARYPSPEKLAAYGNRLAPEIAEALALHPSLGTECPGGRGAPTDPTRFTDYELTVREGEYGRGGFALQFMLDTALSDADRFPLKLSDLICMDLAPKMAPVSLVWASGPQQLLKDVESPGLAGDRFYRPMWVSQEAFAKYTGCVMAVDPAGRGKDEVGYAIVAMLNGWLFLLDAGGLLGGYSDENLGKLARLAKQYGVNEVVVEANFGDGMFLRLLQPHLARVHPCATSEVRSTGQKERRIIDVLEPVLNQHRLVVDIGLLKRDATNYNQHSDDVEQRYQLFRQMTRITYDKGALAHDDRLDALAMAVAWWVNAMDADTSQAEDRRKDELLAQEIEAFLQGVRGGVLGAGREDALDDVFGSIGSGSGLSEFWQ